MKCLIFFLFLGVGHHATLAQLTGTALHMVETGCGGVNWVHYNRDLVKESDMVKSGSMGSLNFYICRVVTESGDSEIGFSQEYQGNQYCDYVDKKGVEKSALEQNFEVLVNFAKGTRNLYWEDSDDGFAPVPGALVAAVDKHNRPMYIAQCPTSMRNGGTCGVRDGYVVGDGYTMKVACNREAPQCKPQRYLMCRNFIGK